MSLVHHRRCAWVSEDPTYKTYHDTEWGVFPRTRRALFELLVLEGAQAGLSWLTVLKKREAYRRAFDLFHPERVAAYNEKKIASLLVDSGIIRNAAKIRATVANARAFLAVEKEFGSFAKFLARFQETPAERRARLISHTPICESETSRNLSRELKRRRFQFVGPVICYSFLQAIGLAGGHDRECFKYRSAPSHLQ